MRSAGNTLALLLWLAGCDRASSGTAPPGPHDGDGDGYGRAADCDDADASIHPDAEERCDGRDNDCDGGIDLMATDAGVLYLDLDEDGHGGAEVVRCPASGLLAAGGDCDDADAAVNPDAAETCDGVDEDCDGVIDDDAVDATAWYGDADADGYGGGDASFDCTVPDGALTESSDCDDADSAVHPGATETCDGRDEDCDGAIDQGATETVYTDADGDGWGGEHTLRACPVPAGWTLTPGDCDDGDAAVSPSAVEVCDASDTDEDCDGASDDADPDAIGTVWYADVDGDGYGDPASSWTACDGDVADATDCDDDDATISPAAVETCDGRDEDCDGTIDEDVASADTWYADLDRDGYGDATNSTVACDAPADHVADATDCDDTDATVSPGATETCDDGTDEDCDGIDAVCGRLSGTVGLADADLRLEGGGAGDLAGWSVAFVADFDGDGGDDLLVGAPEDDTSGAWDGGRGGAARVFGGGHAGTEPISYADTTVLGDPSERAGLAVARAGELWGDGRDWVIVGGLDTAWAIPEPWSMETGEVYGEGGMVCREENTGDATGWAVAGGDDSDGDGADEVYVGAPYNDDGGTSAGKIYRGCEWFGVAATRSYWVASHTGEADGDRAGSALSSAGDVDGDGLGDVLIGAPGSSESASSAGKVYLVLGGASAGSLASADASWTGIVAGDGAGSAVWGGGDLDGDGLDDLAVGSDGAGAWVLLAPSLGAGSLADATLWLEPEASGDGAGGTLSGGADVDGDGAADLVIGAPGSDRGAIDGGALYVIAGPPPAGTLSLTAPDAFVVGEDTDGAAGWSLDATGDADGDGTADILVGAPGLASEAGGALLLLGGP